MEERKKQEWSVVSDVEEVAMADGCDPLRHALAADRISGGRAGAAVATSRREDGERGRTEDWRRR